MQNSNIFQFAATNQSEAVLNEFNSSLSGLGDEQVKKNRTLFGINKVTRGKKKSLLRRFLSSFVDPFTGILIVLASVSAYTDIIVPPEPSIRTVLIIMTMVMMSGILRFVQETRSGNAEAKLLAMITTKTCVARISFGEAEIPLDDVVVGDIVHLSAGDMIPADIRIIHAKDLFISQSALTGESELVEKNSQCCENFSSALESHNIAFMGSNVVSGAATGVVIAVGDRTIFGSIAQTLTHEHVVTSFQKGINSVSWVLIRFMVVMVPFVFVINGVTKGDWMAAFLFAISVAVGMTPEMLPMIVTTCLAKGALAMSDKKTIIKNLNSIQNFGAIDILCADKTGTLTQDKVVLQYHLDLHGNEDTRVLRHAFLNSYYQTGLRNLMDTAIIERTHDEAKNDETLVGLIGNYEKVDEIPFDFERRRMSVIVSDKNGKTQMITKGAVEEMLNICSFVEYQGKVEHFKPEYKAEILQMTDKLNNDGMRVIAVAHKREHSPVGAFSVADEAKMVLIGYIAFLDPPKESAGEAIKALAEYGVTTKILTGDNEKVTRNICKHVGLGSSSILLGSDIENMSEEELAKAAEETSVFAKLSPQQKTMIVTALRRKGHTVGFMGDGINDAAAMKSSDVGISVDTAVDIAKESADVIMLEKDLMVLEEGIIEGRKTYANMIKYIKITASSNFGNMFSVLAASAFLPFLPMMSIHILLLNLIYDLCCVALPWDNVDKEFLQIPRKWQADSIGKFMMWMGPTSSIFDITTYALMYFIICPAFASNGLLFHDIPQSDAVARALYIAMFQTGWFVESMWTQTLIIHTIRTPKIPFLQSRASFPVFALTIGSITTLTIIPFTDIGKTLGFAPLPFEYFPWLALTVSLYILLASAMKRRYIKRFGELL